MPVQRIRPFNRRQAGPDGGFDDHAAMAVRAGRRILLRGQSGRDLDLRVTHPEDAAAQADQAMRNVRALLEEAGSGLSDICRVTTYITDRAYRTPVYNAVAKHLQGIPTCGTGLIVKGLEAPEMKVALDIDAVVEAGGIRQVNRPFNTRDWFGQTTITRESCWSIQTGEEIYLRGLTGAELDGSRMHGLGRGPGDAAAQADRALGNARELITEAGGRFEDIARIRVYIRDRAYREQVYQVLGRHLGDVHPCSTGLVIGGFARPEILFEIDLDVPLAGGQPHRRVRPFHTDAQYKDGQRLGCKFCMAVRAGDRIYLRGQTGLTLDGELLHDGDAAAQADQALRNVRTLLAEAGGTLDDALQVTVYLTDRADGPAVDRVVAGYFDRIRPVRSNLIVEGLANPRMLVEIDVEAVVSQ